MFNNEKVNVYGAKDDLFGKDTPRVVITITDKDIARGIAKYFKSSALDILSEDDDAKSAEEFLRACNQIEASIDEAFDAKESEGAENESV